MLPQHRLGRVLIALTLGAFVALAALIRAAPSNSSADDLVALAPVPVDTPPPLDSPGAAAEATPAPTPVRAPTTDTQFERVLHPLLLAAKRHRQANAAGDPDYWKRVDPRVNATRLNFLLFGYGETHEPPLTERAFIGSLTIFSYDYASRQIDLVSLTHDIRAPEIERFLYARGQQQVGPIKIDQAYSMGGFDLMRRTLEDATGLAIDFQLAFKESAIAGATDNVFGGLDVDVPLAFKVNAYYLDGQKYPGGEFQKGRQRLTGTQVIQFIKTVPVEEHYDLALEHNARKHLVFRSLMLSMSEHSNDVGFLGRAALFFSSQVAQDSIAYDFDLRSLIVDNLRSLMADFARPGTGTRDVAVPSVSRTLYVVDPASGDGSVQWVQANARTNPVTRRDIAQRRYDELAIEVPYHGDPYAADLPVGYWLDVRKLIETRLAD
ncbi:MAG: LCP family protein [Chloroflexota bacterium]|nr:LCP family protein [Chloroflexota bacterium]